jgi:sulfonate transport system substrate-binding protein
MSVYGIAIFNYADHIGLLDGYLDDLPQYNGNVTLAEWASGPDQNVAFAANEIDFSSMGNIPAVTGVVNGYGTKIIGVNYLYTDSYLLVTRAGSGVEKLEDLKGRNVGTYVGTVSHYAIAKYLEYAGLTIDDVNLINVGSEAANSLRNGDIDAAVFGRVVSQQLQDEGTGVIASDESVPIYNYVIGRQAFYEKYPEITTKVLQLINDTWDYALEHRDDYIEFYANASGSELETVQASYAGDNFPIKHAKDFDDSDWERFENFVDWMKSVEYVPEDVTPESLVNRTFVQQIPAPKQ